ncbi:MAG: hypothetical protein H6754_07040 [Candidatus Omnitrophica bacterium]|nr:hypothetical protein [Candidatus Omnitrophota bacterium]
MKTYLKHIAVFVGCLTIALTTFAFAKTTTDISSRDELVLNTVLKDLLTYSGDDSPLKNAKGLPKTIFITPNAPINIQSQTVEKILTRNTQESWEKLTAEQLSATQEAAQNLVDRLLARDFFKDFTSEDTRIQIAKDGVELPRLTGALSAWSPGYSRNETIAVVRLHIPWSRIHSGDGTYILIKEGDAWRVLLRQFNIYL